LGMFVLQRCLLAIPTMLGITLIVFTMLHMMPGDPVLVLLSSSQSTAITEAELYLIRERFGLHDPLPVQYVRFITHAAVGDLGNSILQARPVLELIAEVLPNTIALALASLFLAALLGLLLGIVAAVRHRTLLDLSSMTASLFALSMPEFWLAILAILVVSVKLQWLPSAGSEGLKYLILPAVVLGSRAAASIARLTRSSMLEVLGQQYINTAWAKGLPPRQVIWCHALKNALIPVITFMGLQLGRLLSGAVVVETIFARQGLGKLLIDAILSKDIPVVQGAVLVVALGYVICNLLVDVSYAWLDPRIRYV
jgi:peptide/nickel transport system permease protein